jgi:hypothetical protein
VPAIVNALAPDDLRGRYNGAIAMAWTTGFLTGPIAAGVALGAGAGGALFLTLTAAAVLAAVGSVGLARHLPPGIDVIG